MFSFSRYDTDQRRMLNLAPRNKRMLPKELAQFPVCLAPMVGLSHVVLRLVVRKYLPRNARTIWPTEMLNSRRLPNEDFSKTPEVFRCETEDGLVPQILGNEEGAIHQSVLRLKAWGAVGIDINMGCPVKKALKHNYGVALMGDPKYAAQVVRMTVQASDLPVSVKLRAGEQAKADQLEDFVLGLEEAGASWITLHPRFAHQMRRGTADWGLIGEIRSKLKIPVIGNGDIQTCDDIFEMFEQAECDMVMIGRALTAKPWLLWQFGERMGYEPPDSFSPLARAPSTPEEEGAEFKEVVCHFLNEMESRYPLDLGLRKTRFFLKNAAPWLEFGHDLEARFSKAKSFLEMRGQLEEFYKVPQRMMSRTNLRY
jgi:tRNA-dihydrouridine synthase